MIPVQLIIAAVIAAVSFATAWTYQGNHYERVIAEQRAAQSVLLVEAHANAKRETERIQEIANAAERKHQGRIADMRKSAAATAVIADGLRDDLAAARAAMPGASCDSIRGYSATLSTVFDECATEVGRLASQADGHAIDTLKLLESWPEYNPQLSKSGPASESQKLVR